MKRYQLLLVILFHALLSTKHPSPSVLLPPMQRKEKGCTVAQIKSIEPKTSFDLEKRSKDGCSFRLPEGKHQTVYLLLFDVSLTFWMKKKWNFYYTLSLEIFSLHLKIPS